jgi:hypothetical protein
MGGFHFNPDGLLIDDRLDIRRGRKDSLNL